MTGDRPGNLLPGFSTKVIRPFGGDGDEARSRRTVRRPSFGTEGDVDGLPAGLRIFR